MKHIFNNIFLVCILLSVFVYGASPVSGDVIETRHFSVHYEGVGRYYADLVSETAERSYPEIVRLLGHEPSSVITVILTDDRSRFAELTENALPDWSAAAALPGNRIIISPLEGQKIDIERILAHETVHCIIDDAAGEDIVPRWFHEGCAEMVSGGLGIRGRGYLFLKVLKNDLMTFDAIQRVFSADAQDATLAYDQSLIAVKFLMDIHGPGVIGTILTGLKQERGFPASFEQATGVLPGEFENAYLAYVSEAYGWRALVTFIPGTWTTILVLAFLVYFVKKYRTRKLLREWDKSDKPGNIIDFDSFHPDDT